MEGIPTFKGSWPWPWIRHTVVHHSSTSTYTPNFIQIEETFCGRTDGHFSPSLILLGRLLEVDLKTHTWLHTKCLRCVPSKPSWRNLAICECTSTTYTWNLQSSSYYYTFLCNLLPTWMHYTKTIKSETEYICYKTDITTTVQMSQTTINRT